MAQFWGDGYTLYVQYLHLSLEPIKDILTFISTDVIFNLIHSMRLCCATNKIIKGNDNVPCGQRNEWIRASLVSVYNG